MTKSREDMRDLVFSQWRVFSRILQRVEIDAPLIGAVFYRRRGALVLPGANLTVMPKAATPANLYQTLIESCPNPDNHRDVFAAAETYRYFEKHPDVEVVFAAFPSAETVWLGSFDGAARLEEAAGLRLLWPDRFEKRMMPLFAKQGRGIRTVVFAAYPLSFGTRGRSPEVRHVGYLYFGVSQSTLTRGLLQQAKDWVRTLVDLMTWGVLAYESENRAVWDDRLARVKAWEASEELLTVTKYAAHTKEEVASLTAQVACLHRMRDRVHSAGIHFPRVSRVVRDPIPYYKMARFHLPSLRKLLCTPGHPAEHEVEQIVRRLLEFLFADVYVPTREKPDARGGRLVSAQIGSRLNRVKGTQALLERIARGEPVAVGSSIRVIEETEYHRVLSLLLDRNAPTHRRIRVTDQSYADTPDAACAGFPYALLQDKHTGERIRPPYVAEAHGDLHFDNILVDSYFPHEPIFVLIDPRGGGLGDPAADVGKLLCSCQSGYDFADSGHFDVDVRPDDRGDYSVRVELPSIRSTHESLKAGASAADLVSFQPSLPRTTPRLYTLARDIVRTTADTLARTMLADDELVTRADFYNGLFCIVTAPKLCLENPGGALALLTRGCRILEDWRVKVER